MVSLILVSETSQTRVGEMVEIQSPFFVVESPGIEGLNILSLFLSWMRDPNVTPNLLNRAFWESR